MLTRKDSVAAFLMNFSNAFRSDFGILVLEFLELLGLFNKPKDGVMRGEKNIRVFCVIGSVCVLAYDRYKPWLPWTLLYVVAFKSAVSLASF